MFVLIAILLLSGNTFSATDFLFSTQHLNITRQNETGHLHGISANHEINSKTNVGLGGTYQERFSLYEKAFALNLGHRFNDYFFVEGRYQLGEQDNQILPRDEKELTAYFAALPGLSPFVYYRDRRYSEARLNQFGMGLAIEHFPHLILVPQYSFGNSTFNSPAQTKSVHSLGLRAIYYQEKKFSVFLFGHKSREASQGIIGKSTQVIDVLGGGLGGSAQLTKNIKTELIIDHSDYDQLKTQFITTTLNLLWRLGT